MPSLTHGEREVLARVAWSSEQAERTQLGTSVKTVKTHLRQPLKRIGAW